MQIVLHDYFESAEGGGRLSLILAEAIRADLAYGFKVNEHPYFQGNTFQGKEFPLTSFTNIPIWRQLKIAKAFSNKTLFLKNYETAIYSGFYAPLAVNNHSNGRNIYYCHTPPRFLYDQRDFFFSLIPKWQRPILHAFNQYLKPRYEDTVKKMDIIIANSKNVQERIKKYLGLDSQIIHPPCETEKFKWLGQEDYYLSIARLDPLKRVDLVVEAFRKMKDKKLIVASGGPDLEKIRKQAEASKNIQVLGWVSEEKLQELMGNCIATIYIPKDEDFGMSPVESMATGKPVIGVAEGGLMETIVHEETGLLLSPNPTLENIINGVKTLSSKEAQKMRPNCERRAQMFSKEIFVEKIKNEK